MEAEYCPLNDFYVRIAKDWFFRKQSQGPFIAYICLGTASLETQTRGNNPQIIIFNFVLMHRHYLTYVL